MKGGLRHIGIVTAAIVLLSAAAAGQSDVAALRAAKERAAAASERSEFLRQEAASAEATADRFVARRAALAAEIDTANAEIAAARARIAIISRRQKEHAALLGGASAPLMRLNALLQSMTRISSWSMTCFSPAAPSALRLMHSPITDAPQKSNSQF